MEFEAFGIVVVVVALFVITNLASARRKGARVGEQSCRQCGGSNPSLARFCRRCGRELKV